MRRDTYAIIRDLAGPKRLSKCQAIQAAAWWVDGRFPSLIAALCANGMIRYVDDDEIAELVTAAEAARKDK